MPLATLRIQSNDPQSPTDLPLVSLIGNQEQTAACEAGFTGDPVTIAEGTPAYSRHTLALANAAALAAAEAALVCEGTPPWEPPGAPGSNGSVITVGLQSNGKIIIGGDFTQVQGVAHDRIARLNIDGTIDSSFTTAISGGTARVLDIKVQPDDKILVAGNFTTVNGESRQFVRLNSDGSVDSSFTSPTFDSNDNVQRILVLSNGQIVIGGAWDTINAQANRLIAKLDSDGTLASGYIDFDSSGPSANWNDITGLSVQSDGKVIACGVGRVADGQFHKCVLRINTDWTVDHTFGSGLDNVASFLIYDVAALPNDDVICIGTFASYDGVARNGMMKLSGSNGAVDATYNPNIQAGVDGRRIVTDDNGKVIIVGIFTTVGGVTRKYLARLDASGGLDTTWPDYNPNFQPFQVAVQPDGKVVVVGNFTSFGGQSWSRVVRLLDDGTIDS